MNTSAIPPEPGWKAWYRGLRFLVQGIGTFTMLSGMVVSTAYWVYEYQNSCDAKGVGLYLCLGGSLGLVDVDKIFQKDQEIGTLRATLERAEARVRQLEKDRSQAGEQQPGPSRELTEALAALKRATEEIKRKEARIGELEDRLKKTSEGKRPDPPTTGGRATTRRPNPNTYSESIWPSGTIRHGETVRRDTEFGPIQCTGGNNNIGVLRACIWVD